MDSTVQGAAAAPTNDSAPTAVSKMDFDEALRHLVAMERKLRLELGENLRELRLHATQRRIDAVTAKASRLYTMRQRLSSSRSLLRQEKEVLREFDKIKLLLNAGEADLDDEDGWDKTRQDCAELGGRLADIRRRQRRLSGQVVDLDAGRAVARS